MKRLKTICVLCGAREGFDPAYRDAAISLGRLAAKEGARIVYGGGSIGLMGVVARASLAEGGQVIGISPDFLIGREGARLPITEMVVTEGLYDRKLRMFEMADIVVVLPGGLGTLDEAFEIITLKQLGLAHCPIVVIDVNGYWAPLQALIENVSREGFADPSANALCTFVRRAEDVFTVFDVPHRHEEFVASVH